MVLKKGSKWSNWSWDKPVKAFIWRSSRICRPIGGLPPGVFEDSLPHLLLRNNSNVVEDRIRLFNLLLRLGFDYLTQAIAKPIKNLGHRTGRRQLLLAIPLLSESL